MPGAGDGTGGVVGASRFCESPILLGDRLGKGGGGGGGMTIATRNDPISNYIFCIQRQDCMFIAGLGSLKGTRKRTWAGRM